MPLQQTYVEQSAVSAPAATMAGYVTGRRAGTPTNQANSSSARSSLTSSRQSMPGTPLVWLPCALSDQRSRESSQQFLLQRQADINIRAAFTSQGPGFITCEPLQCCDLHGLYQIQQSCNISVERYVVATDDWVFDNLVLCSHLRSTSTTEHMHAFVGQARQSTASSARTGGNSRPSSRGGAGSPTNAQGVDDNDNIKARVMFPSWLYTALPTVSMQLATGGQHVAT